MGQRTYWRLEYTETVNGNLAVDWGWHYEKWDSLEDLLYFFAHDMCSVDEKLGEKVVVDPESLEISCSTWLDAKSGKRCREKEGAVPVVTRGKIVLIQEEDALLSDFEAVAKVMRVVEMKK